MTYGTVQSADGVLIAYSDHGGTHPALVFLHGWACDRGFWANQVAAFGAAYRVVCIDLGGHGESGTDRTEWTPAAMGEDVRAVIEALRLDRIVLIGHSLGGPIALEAARRMPKKVVGVVGVDTLHDVEHELDEEQREIWVRRYERDFVGTCASMVRRMLPAGTAPALVGEITDKMCAAPPEIAVAVLRGFKNYDAAAALGALRSPFRAINSGITSVTNLEGNRKHARDYDAVIMDGVGHFPQLEAPAEFNRRLRAIIEELLEAPVRD